MTWEIRLMSRLMRKSRAKSGRWVNQGVLLAAVVAIGCATCARAADAGWQVGTARVNITPTESMWMSGYGNRDRPSEGKLTDLWAKAVAIADGSDQRVVLVTLDLVGIDRGVSQAIRTAVEAKWGIGAESIALNSSHTHTGPVVGSNLRSMYFYDDAQQALVDGYTEKLIASVVEMVGQAIDDTEPCAVTYGNGQATFAVNRRNNQQNAVPELRAKGSLIGPVDYDVPVLVARNAESDVKAIVFGYACHATVLSFYQWSGDYPGFAQMAVEAAHPGATALFFAGCGADINPLPRRSVALAEHYGEALGAAVNRVVASVMRPVSGEIETAYDEIELAFDTLPTKDELQKGTESSNRFEASRARRLLATIEADGSLSPTYPYPVQTWRLGNELTWVTLGGEVVVDFALRLKLEHGAATTWVAGYTNDVMAYIPSRRVLLEGGYEGGGAMVYYGLPTVWAPDVEERIVTAVRRQVEQTRP